MIFLPAGFQSTRPRGRTRLPKAHRGDDQAVSIHASSREDATHGRHRLSDQACFNPRVLAGGRDGKTYEDYRSGYVSIHASSREDATRTRRGIQIGIKVSIHASSREDATLFKILVRIFTIVSIHASSREDATLTKRSILTTMEFQSTRPRGRTRRSGCGS